MDTIEKYPAIQGAISFTTNKLDQLKNEIDQIDLRKASLIVNGSFARNEASEQSDFDYFLMFPRNARAQDMRAVLRNVNKIVKKVIGKLPAKDGAFAATTKCGELTQKIGGEDDTNKNITRRILFLTEGFPLGDRKVFDEQKKELIERYIESKISDHQLALFFLNDVIRYWRTMCVDFENKTFEKGKEWGIRNIKLVFSRKLLYFGGILIAAETAQRTPKEKREIVSTLMDMTPLQRLIHVCGPTSERALAEYNLFLAKMTDGNFRAMLAKTERDRDTHKEQFKTLKNAGHSFSLHLMSALRTTYSESHPIHRSLIM